MVDLRVAEWRAKFSNLQGGKEIVSLTGETSADLRLLEKGDLIVCTPMQPHLDHVTDSGLAEILKHGIGYYHEALNKQDKRIVERLFQSGAIQSYEGKEHRYVDYPVMDVLQMMGRACRPTEDDKSRCIVMCQQTRKDFYKKFLAEGLPIESHLPTHMLHDYFLAEIAVKTIENKQDAMVITTSSQLAHRANSAPGHSDLDLLLPAHDTKSQLL
ncbi:hypothetical protein IEO21_03006 [Rhodonia placenta]|uniref:Uncharacterized protein n=1 Tax=Rhodonia placenta TaxID=104341 RepID=A0A8H7P6H3_9APHY|nr:hypothetical protein IEO21_03006 [Postia placenta]